MTILINHATPNYKLHKYVSSFLLAAADDQPEARRAVGNKANGLWDSGDVGLDGLGGYGMTIAIGNNELDDVWGVCECGDGRA